MHALAQRQAYEKAGVLRDQPAIQQPRSERENLAKLNWFHIGSGKQVLARGPITEARAIANRML